MPTKIDHLHRLWIIIAIFLISLTGAACGRGQSGAAGEVQAAPTAPPLPVPTKNFVAVGQLTVLTDTNSVTETTQTTSASADLTRGEAAYTKNKCGDCHGAKGEGVADKGSAVAGTIIPFEEFDAVLRTGGGLGNTHIFGRSAVSPSGMEALYAYVQSLPAK